jgi:hypothetical protein
MTTIYRLERNRDQYVFYIGITRQPLSKRLYQHTYYYQRGKDPISDFLRKCNNEVSILPICRTLDPYCIERVERYFINRMLYLDYQLFNTYCIAPNPITKPIHEFVKDFNNRVEILDFSFFQRFIW